MTTGNLHQFRMRRVRTLAGGRIRFCDSEYGETTARCLLRRFETLLMGHTFRRNTGNFTLGDVLHMVYGVFDVKQVRSILIRQR